MLNKILVYKNILLALSVGFASLLITNANMLNIDTLPMQAGLFVVAAVTAFVALKFVKVWDAFSVISSWWQWALIGYVSVFSLYVAVQHYFQYFATNFPNEITDVFLIKLIAMSLGGLFATVVAWVLTVWVVCRLYKKLAFTKLEKRLIAIYSLIGLLIAITLSVFVTSNFVLKLNIVDTIYAMDSSALITGEIHDNNLTGLNTDIRHPIAQAANTPMGIISRILGNLFYFIPYAQAHIFQLFTIIMIAVTGILITRLINAKRSITKSALFIAYVTLYSTLVFTFAVEQYVPAVLFMTLFVYGVINKWSLRWNIFFLIVSAGFIVTSAVMGVLLLVKKGDSLRDRLSKGAIALAAFIGTIIISGKVLTIFAANKILEGSSGFSGDMSLIDKLHQFTNFIASTLTAGYHEIFFDGTFHKYRTAEMAIHQVNPVGIIILLLVLIGAWVGRKSMLTWIAAGWSAFAFIICVVVGWGAAYNEMALYSFYFGWAYLILVFIALRWLVERIVAGRRKTQEIVLAGLLLALAVTNVVLFSDVLAFTARHYPSQPTKELINERLQRDTLDYVK